MRLKLRVISDHYRQLGKASSRVFDQQGGRIGRATDNEWVLPDPERYVSSHHCTVSFKGGRWLLEDTSTNGVFVNGSGTPVAVEGPYTLKDSDRLRLGDYEIFVSIDERESGARDVRGSRDAPPINDTQLSRYHTEDLGEDLDLMSLLGPASSSSAKKRSSSSKSSRPAAKAPPEPPSRPEAMPVSSMLDATSDQGQARTVVHSDRPPDWQLATRPYKPPPREIAKEPVSRPTAGTAERRASGGHAELDAGVEAFCRGAGIDPGALSLDSQAVLLTLAGQMVRETVVGLLEALHARSEFKSRMRLDQTTIQPAENNPLKFASSVDDAIRKLLDAHGSRYLPPVEAIREAFLDLRSHEQALGSAVKLALEGYLMRFAPGELEQGFDRGLKRGGLLGAANRMKYWDLYTDFYKLVTQPGEDGLPSTFSEELGKAYDARARELRQTRRRR